MAKRISDIAKELGIASKAIVEKCLAEGIDSDKVKGHMSTVGPGLEATIREWFSTESGSHTAVETLAHVDIEQVKAKTPARSRKKKEDGSDSSGPSRLTLIAQSKVSLWSVDLFRCESILLRSFWVMVVMDVFTRRIIGFGVARAHVDGVSVCRLPACRLRIFGSMCDIRLNCAKVPIRSPP